MDNQRPWTDGRTLPPKADVYERRLDTGRVFLAFFDGIQWMIGASSFNGALRQHVTSPLQTAAEWREIK